MSTLQLEPAAPTVCGRALGRARHACAFVSSEEEATGILNPFADEGIERGERVLQIVADGKRDAHLDAAARRNPKWAKAAASEQLSVIEWKDAYLKDGYFDADRMLGMLREFLADRRARGFPLGRAMATMEWALKGARGTEHLIEYESRANIVANGNPDAFVCTYDATRFPASTIVDVLRVHPVAIIGGVVYENPYYTEPETMLRELAERRRA